jgi:hypothetical protein
MPRPRRVFVFDAAANKKKRASMAEFTKAQLQKAFEVEQERRSLDFFEPRRRAIADACSKGLGIPEHEFELSQGTEFFHFLTTLIAVGEWVADTGMAFMWKRQEEGYAAWREYPWTKAVSGAITRLVLHPLSIDISAPEKVQFINAFMQASTPEEMDAQSQHRRALMVQAVLMSYRQCRSGVIRAVKGYWETGRPGGLKDWEFEGFDNFLAQSDPDDDRCHLFPREAERDAYGTLYSEFAFLIKENEALPGPMPRDPQPVGADKAFDLAKRYMIQFSLFRKKAALTGEKFTGTKRSFADALGALGTPKQFALFENVRDEGGDEGTVLPVFLHREGAGASVVQHVARNTDSPFKFEIVGLQMV